MLNREERMIAEDEKGVLSAWDEFELTSVLHRITMGSGTNVGFLAEEIVKQLPEQEVMLLVERLGGILSDKHHG